MSKESTTSGGIGLSGLVFVLFLTLKLIGVKPVSEWSWWWVTCPLWWWLPLILAILIPVGLIAIFKK